MNEHFTKEFIAKLNGKLGTEELKIVFNELELFSELYSINPKSTNITIRQEFIPQEYKVYMVSKQIEGLSSKSLKTYNIHLKDFFEHIHKPLSEITTNDIRVYLYGIQNRRNVSNRTLDSIRLIINGFMEWCNNEGYIYLTIHAKQLNV